MTDPSGFGGCGPGFNIKVLNQPFGFNFTDACGKHDIGYDTYLKPKDETDLEFLHNMMLVCDEPCNVGKPLCKKVAKTYYNLVHYVGWIFYYSAQKKVAKFSRGSGGVRG